MPSDTQTQVLRLGSPDRAAVSDWQTTLARLDLPPGPGAIDGIFGPKTEAATKALQRVAGIKVDGIVGPETRAAAERLDKRDTKPENLIHGVDVSAWQGEIDWPLVASAGQSFAWIKLSEGADHLDKRFAANWTGAHEAGLLRGAYHFFSAASSPAAQAEAFLRALPAGSTLPPVLDVERGLDGGAPRAAAVVAWFWLVEEGLRARGGERFTKPWIYSSPSYAKTYLQGAPALADHGLWVAHYGVETPTVPPPWRDWDGWQSTGDGRCDGIAGPVDLDVLRAEALASAT